MLHSAILLLCHYTDFFHLDKNLLKSFPQGGYFKITL